MGKSKGPGSGEGIGVNGKIAGVAERKEISERRKKRNGKEKPSKSERRLHRVEEGQHLRLARCRKKEDLKKQNDR